MHVLRKPRTALRIAQYPVASTRLDAGRRPPGQDSALTSADKAGTSLEKAWAAVNKKKTERAVGPSSKREAPRCLTANDAYEGWLRAVDGSPFWHRVRDDDTA